MIERLQRELFPESDVPEQVLGGPIGTGNCTWLAEIVLDQSAEERIELGLARLQDGNGFLA